MNANGEAVRGLVKNRVEFAPAQIRFLIMRSSVHANSGLAECIFPSGKGLRKLWILLISAGKAEKNYTKGRTGKSR